VKTYKLRNRPKGSITKSPTIHRVEVGPVRPTILDRRSGSYQDLPKGKTGIPFYDLGQYSVTLVNNTWLSLVYVHQLCWNAYKYGNTDSKSLKDAKHAYYYLHRKLSQWDSVLRYSIVVQQYWSVISLTLRFAKDGAKRRGRPLCGNDRETLRGSADLLRDSE